MEKYQILVVIIIIVLLILAVLSLSVIVAYQFGLRRGRKKEISSIKEKVDLFNS